MCAPCSVQNRAQHRAGMRVARTRTRIKMGAERVGTPQAWPHTCLTPTLAPLVASEPGGRRQLAWAAWRHVDCFQQPWASAVITPCLLSPEGMSRSPHGGGSQIS